MVEEVCGSEPRSNFFFRLRNRQKLMWVRFGCGLDLRIYGSHRSLLLQYHVYMSAKRNLSESMKRQGDVMVNTKTEKHTRVVHLLGL